MIKEKNKPEDAKVTAVKTPQPLKLRPIGLDAGKVRMSDDFDEPLPDDFMKAFR